MSRKFLSLSLLTALIVGPALAEEVTLTPSKDNTLFQSDSGSLSNGAGIYLFAGKTGGNLTRRALLEFDIAGAVPAGATITRATLTLHLSRTISGAMDLSLHRVLAEWGEGTSDSALEEGKGAAATAGDATWVHTSFDTSLWTNPGGDFATAASATTPVEGVGTYTWESPQMAVDVQGWLSDPESNFGWVLIGGEAATNTAKRFDSREHTQEANRPVLTLSFDATAVNASTWGQVKEGR